MRTILLLITLLSLTAGLQAQTGSVSISATNAPVKDVFAEIQQKSGYRILYNDEIVPDDLRVTINTKDRPVKEVLDTLLRNTELAYIMQSDELIVITDRKFRRKNSRITGIVKDDLSGEPLPYVNVVLSDPDSTFAGGVATDDKGVFILDKIILDDAILTLSMMGYDTRFIQLRGLDGEVDLGELLLVQEVKKLDEVIVESSLQLRSIDKQIFFPTEAQKNKSTNGLQLTQRLLLPMIFVNPQTGTISYAGDKKLKILINGVEAVSQEVLALQPDDVIRIDYYDNPSMRYGEDIGLILDYIVKKRTTGGFLSANLMEIVKHEVLGNGQLSGGVNFGKSQIKFYYYLNHNDSKTSSLKQQTFRFPSGNTISRTEDGKQSRWSEIFQMGDISYTCYGEKNIFNVKGGLFSINQRYNDLEGDIMIRETNQATHYKTYDRPQTLRPSIDIYFARQIDDEQIVALNIVGTRSKNIVDYRYNETLNDKTTSDITTFVDGKRHSLITEIFYEKKFSESVFSTGLRHTQGYTENLYTGSSDFKTEMNDAISYGFLQYKGEKGKWGYMGGAGISRTYFQQKRKDDTYNRWTVSPMLSVDYRFNNTFSLRYSYQLRNINPSLSHLSDVERLRNSYQLDKGNPSLDSYLFHNSELRFSMNPSPVKSSFSLRSYYFDKPIMEETYYDDSRNIFVTINNNQKKTHQLTLQYNIGVSLFNDHLSINGYGGYNTTVSEGNNYRHTQNEWFYLLQTIADYKKLSLTVTMVQLVRPFWGETVSIGHSYNHYTLNYRFPWGQLGVTSMNLFREKTKKYSYSYNALTGYEREVNSEKLYPSLGIYGSINLNWGKQNKETRQKLNNSDSESGIL
ncbi:TonB-dependent receptor [uncultured Proteiniphilum sp.]|uniref:TonB-dependent receptor n=1 Tax=uncultured Proteiniphilum sp. TaxID=497637 RepID=UPI0026185B34|nr:TonB-dependent receptor [uncultured Proteiniphilum sp.]